MLVCHDQRKQLINLFAPTCKLGANPSTPWSTHREGVGCIGIFRIISNKLFFPAVFHIEWGCTVEDAIVCTLVCTLTKVLVLPSFLLPFGDVHRERLEVGSWKFQLGNYDLWLWMERSIWSGTSAFLEYEQGRKSRICNILLFMEDTTGEVI